MFIIIQQTRLLVNTGLLNSHLGAFTRAHLWDGHLQHKTHTLIKRHQ